MRVAFRKHFDTQILNLCARTAIPFRPREKDTDRETAENLQIDDDLLGESRVGSYHTNQQFLADSCQLPSIPDRSTDKREQ